MVHIVFCLAVSVFCFLLWSFICWSIGFFSHFQSNVALLFVESIFLNNHKKFMHASPVKFPSVENKNFKEYETSARHNSKCHRNSIQYISFACLPLSLFPKIKESPWILHIGICFIVFGCFFFPPKYFEFCLEATILIAAIK